MTPLGPRKVWPQAGDHARPPDPIAGYGIRRVRKGLAFKDKLSRADHGGVQLRTNLALLAALTFGTLAQIARLGLRDITSNHLRAKLDPCFHVE